ncbi:MAG: hypothetical protein ABEI75_04765 [Halobaculum sp.]
MSLQNSPRGNTGRSLGDRLLGAVARHVERWPARYVRMRVAAVERWGR